MNSIKRITSLLLTFCLVLAVCGCGTQQAVSQPAESASTATSSSETVASEPAESSAPAESRAEKSEEQKPVLLAVSFGSSYNDTRDVTIGAVEEALQKAYPEYEVRRAFTAQTIIDILKDREKLEIDNVSQAMARLVMDGVKEVVIQPTHVMSGAEYDDVIAEITPFEKQFDSFKIGKTLLTEDSDYQALIDTLIKETADYNKEGTAVVFMGHGTHHAANATYATLQKKLVEAGHNNYFIGTVEATPSLDDVMALVKESGAKKVVLLPLMIVAGDHANNDMAGDEEDSWKTAFKNAGYEVECVLKGLGQYDGIQQLIIKHAGEAINSRPALSADMIKNGSYDIKAKSSASMFKVVKCVLNVKDDSMSAVMTMSGKGYGKLFAGTGEEALKADESSYIMAQNDENGAVCFDFPIEALNSPTECAAWSINRERWYDRTLIFLADSIPEQAIITE